MRFKYEDFKKIEIHENKNYFIKRQDYYKNLEEGMKDLRRIYNLMKRTRDKNIEKYEDISFAIGISKTKGETAIKEKVKTKGRPRYKVHGKPTNVHIHIACYGKLSSVFVVEITKKLNKKIYKDKESYKNRGYKNKRLFTSDKLSTQNCGLDYFNYIWKQSEAMLTEGNLDFDAMKENNLYFSSYNEE